MNVQAVLFVGEATASTEAWRQALFLPLGSEPALVHMARHVALRCRTAGLVVPSRLFPQLRHCHANITVHAYKDRLGDAALADVSPGPRSTTILLIDAGRLPRVDVAAMLAAHRNAGGGMTVFYDTSEQDYCREQLTTDPAGVVSQTVRQYTDSRTPALQREPLAVALSRRMFRPDRSCSVTNFAELTEYLKQRMQRAGDRIRWVHDPAAVRGFTRPLDALLNLLEDSAGAPSTAAASASAGGAAARLLGPIEIGKDVSIGPGAIIVGPAALGDGAVVGAGAVISHSIVLPGESVRDGSHAHRKVVGTIGGPLCGDCQSEIPECCFESAHSPPDPTVDRWKRVFDVVASAIALVLLLPLWIVVATAIKLTSRGPVFFRQRRQGLGGIEFNCLKFRTMVNNADELQRSLRAQNEVDGPQFKLAHDPRVTRVGSFLRRTNIDELPQLINVLIGQMSLVGPRPSPDRENQCCPPWRKARLSVRPGITGLWQVARSDDRRMTDFQEWIYYDTRYVENSSFRLDLQIIWQTIRVLLRLGPNEHWRAQWLPKPQHLRPLPMIDRKERLRVPA